MSLFSRKKNTNADTDSGMWNAIAGPEELGSIVQRSEEKPQLIFKHSNRCGVSFLAKQQLDSVSEQIRATADLYLVDVIGERELSNEIAASWDIRHESPQVIILKGGQILWSGSHWEVKEEIILGVQQAA